MAQIYTHQGGLPKIQFRDKDTYYPQFRNKTHKKDKWGFKKIYPYMQFAFELCVMYHQQFLMDFSELKSWTVYDAIFITISELKPNCVNKLDLKPIGKNTWSPIIKINRRKKKVQLFIPPWEDIYLLACGWSIQVWGRKYACSAHTPDLAMVIITFGPRLIK